MPHQTTTAWEAVDIKTAREAIDALGGYYAVAKLFGLDERVVSNWRTRGLPPDTYAVLGPLLREQGLRFSMQQLFRMRQPKSTPHKVQRLLEQRRIYERKADGRKR